MINKYKYKTFVILVCFLFAAGCQGVKDTFEGKQINNSDEFLVEKKNPLVLPPEFNILPEPGSSDANVDTEEELIMKKIIGQKKTSQVDKSQKTKSYDTIEKSILDKIK